MTDPRRSPPPEDGERAAPPSEHAPDRLPDDEAPGVGVLDDDRTVPPEPAEPA